MRSDRSGTPFALVVFDFKSQDPFIRCEGFVTELKTCVRATDLVGVIEVRRIGVLLSDTTAEGAWNFVAKTESFTIADRPLSCEVFVYPSRQQEQQSSKVSHNREDVGQIQQECSHGRILLSESSDSSLATGTATLQQAACRTNSMMINQLSTSEKLVHSLLGESQEIPSSYAGPRVARPLEALFARQMPVWKRSLDLVGAVFGLVAFLPLLVAVATLIKCTSPGPVIFRQVRSGRGGKPFTMYKFRSMVTDAEARKQELLEKNEQDGPAFKIERDPRITTIGHFIRKTSLDELPQLWNVVRGEMSLVGPRPLPCNETNACENWQRRRLEVTPGLTCIWQVQDRRTKIPFAEWARMDLRYIHSRTPKKDLQLVLRTIRCIFGRKGV